MHSSNSSNARSVLSSWFSAEERGPSADDHQQAPSYVYAPIHPSQAKRLEKKRGSHPQQSANARLSRGTSAGGVPPRSSRPPSERRQDSAVYHHRYDAEDDFSGESSNQHGPRFSRDSNEGLSPLHASHSQVVRRYNREAFDYRGTAEGRFTASPAKAPGTWRSPASHTPPKRAQRRARFKDHLSAEEVEKGLKDGSLLQGVLRVNHKRMRLAYVSVDGFDKDILIDGIFARNRAFEGDTVVIRLNDPSEWEVVKDKDEDEDDADDGEDDAADNDDEEDDDEAESVSPDDEEVEARSVLDDSLLVDSMSDTTDDEMPNGAGNDDDEERTLVPVSDGKTIDIEDKVIDRDSTADKQDTDDDEEEEDEEEGSHATAPVSESPSRGWWQPSQTSATTIEGSSSEGETRQSSNGLASEPLTPVIRKGKRCWRCQEIGHVSRDCQGPRKDKKPREPAVSSEKKQKQLPAKLPVEVKEGGEVKLRRTAKVVAITKSNHVEEMVGYLKPCGLAEEELGKGNFMAFFVPLEKRMPRILVPVKRLPASLINHPNELTTNLFVCKLSGWPSTSAHPKGDLIKNMGCSGDMEVELRVLLEENGIDWEDSFAPEVLACLPEVPPAPARWEIPKEEMARRKDMRRERIFTIDPATAKDMDDAVSCKPLPDGTYQVGVHIADVTYFVKPGTPLDEEGKKRATTVYMVHRSIPMLPRLLSDNMCSLVPGEDRLAFSVLWRMNKEGEVLEAPWFGRSIIRSCVKMSYEAAQEMIDGCFSEPVAPEANGADGSAASDKPQSAARRGSVFLKDATAPEHRVEDIIADVKVLNEMAKRLRQKRFDEGSLTLEDAKMYFCLDEDKMPIDVGTYVRTASHFLIEEFMLLANKSVAKRILEAYPDGALLRRHPPPNENKLSEFISVCKSHSIDFDSSCSKGFQRSLSALALLPNPDIAVVVTRLAMKPMSVAKYTCTDAEAEPQAYRHYALAFDHYTHFTSPIRRYADVVVHRLLDAALQEAPAPLEKEEVASIAENCNMRKTKADKAQDKCDLVFLCTLLKNQSPKDLDATVVTVNSRSFEVYIPLYGVEKLAHAEDLHLAKFDHDKKRQTLYLHWRRAHDANAGDGQQQAKTVMQEIKPFSRLKVRLYPDLQRRPIDVRLAIVPPEGADVPSTYYDAPVPAEAASKLSSTPATKPKTSSYKPLRQLPRDAPAPVRPLTESQMTGGEGYVEQWVNGARETEAHQKLQIARMIEAFIQDPTQTKLHLPADLSSYERRLAHEVAEEHGLSHHSANFYCAETGAKQRRLTLFKKPLGSGQRARSRSLPAVEPPDGNEFKRTSKADNETAHSGSKTPSRPKKPYKSKSVARAPGEDGAAAASADSATRRKTFRKTKEGAKERAAAVRDQLLAGFESADPSVGPAEVRTKVSRPKRTSLKQQRISPAVPVLPVQPVQLQERFESV